MLKPSPSPEALEQALNVLLLPRPFKHGRPVTVSVGGLLDIQETPTRWGTEADVKLLAGQIDRMAMGSTICNCGGNATHWHPNL